MDNDVSCVTDGADVDYWVVVAADIVEMMKAIVMHHSRDVVDLV